MDKCGAEYISEIMISPDGKSVYLIDPIVQSMITYDRNTFTGLLTFNNENELNQFGHEDMTLSPDGLFMYMASSGLGFITVYDRDPTTGAITRRDSIIDSVLNGVKDLSMSPDGRFLYATGRSSNTLVVLQRNETNGALNIVQKINRDSSFTSDRFRPTAMALSQYGNLLYIVSSDRATIYTFRRNATTGMLTFADKRIAPTLLLADKIVFSHDERYLYTVSNSSYLGVFQMGSDGFPEFKYALESDYHFGWRDTIDGALPSPDGRFLYLLNDTFYVRVLEQIRPDIHYLDFRHNSYISNLNFGQSFLDDHYDLNPNDTFDSATDFTQQSQGTLSEIVGLGKYYDPDWYRLHNISHLTIALTKTLGNPELSFEIYDANGNLYASALNTYTLSNPGDYLVRIRGEARGQTYDLSWNSGNLPITTGVIFHDLDQNGIRSVSEQGLAGITVFSDINRNGILDLNEPCTVTQEDDPATPTINELGYFTLTLIPGNHIIRVADHLGWKTSYPDPSVIRGNGELALIDIESTDQNIPLEGISNIAQSHDGIYLYTTNQHDNTLTVFKRNPGTGSTELIQTIGSSEAEGLTEPSHITLSPDGLHAYVSAFEADAIVMFSRNPNDGQLAYLNTITSADTDLTNLDGPRTSLISDDGAYLYLANFWSDTILVFARDENSGSLSLIDQYTNDVDGVVGIDGIRGLTLSPDQDYLYATGFSSDAVAVFTRSPETGILEFAQVLNNNSNGVTGLDGVSSITLSPDGLFAYTTGQNEDAITLFKRNPADGTLTFNKLYRNNILGVKNIDGVIDLIIPPDGQDLYAAGSFSDAIAQFKRNSETGYLTYHSSVVDNIGTAEGLDGVQSLVVSNDGMHVYAGGFASGALTAWSRYYTTQVYEVDFSFGEIEDGLLFGSKQPADVNRNGNANADDIDLIYNILPFGVNFASFDVNEDGELNQGDIDSAVRDMFGTEYGDSNLDRVVNLVDLAILATHYGNTAKSWAEGDFTGDKMVDMDDLALLAQYFGTDSRPADMAGGQGAAEESVDQAYDMIEAASDLTSDEAIYIGETIVIDHKMKNDSQSQWSHVHSLLDDKDQDSLL